MMPLIQSLFCSAVGDLKEIAAGCLDLDAHECRIWDMVDGVPLNELEDRTLVC
jgi:hypothetical protein